MDERAMIVAYLRHIDALERQCGILDLPALSSRGWWQAIRYWFGCKRRRGAFRFAAHAIEIGDHYRLTRGISDD